MLAGLAYSYTKLHLMQQLCLVSSRVTITLSHSQLQMISSSFFPPSLTPESVFGGPVRPSIASPTVFIKEIILRTLCNLNCIHM